MSLREGFSSFDPERDSRANPEGEPHSLQKENLAKNELSGEEKRRSLFDRIRANPRWKNFIAATALGMSMLDGFEGNVHAEQSRDASLEDVDSREQYSFSPQEYMRIFQEIPEKYSHMIMDSQIARIESMLGSEHDDEQFRKEFDRAALEYLYHAAGRFASGDREPAQLSGGEMLSGWYRVDHISGGAVRKFNKNGEPWMVGVKKELQHQERAEFEEGARSLDSLDSGAIALVRISQIEKLADDVYREHARELEERRFREMGNFHGRFEQRGNSQVWVTRTEAAPAPEYRENEYVFALWSKETLTSGVAQLREKLGIAASDLMIGRSGEASRGDRVLGSLQSEDVKGVLKQISSLERTVIRPQGGDRNQNYEKHDERLKKIVRDALWNKHSKSLYGGVTPEENVALERIRAGVKDDEVRTYELKLLDQFLDTAEKDGVWSEASRSVLTQFARVKTVEYQGENHFMQKEAAGDDLVSAEEGLKRLLDEYMKDMNSDRPEAKKSLLKKNPELARRLVETLIRDRVATDVSFNKISVNYFPRVQEIVSAILDGRELQPLPEDERIMREIDPRMGTLDLQAAHEALKNIISGQLSYKMVDAVGVSL